MNTTRFLKYVWPFYNIIHESLKITKRMDKTNPDIIGERYARNGDSVLIVNGEGEKYIGKVIMRNFGRNVCMREETSV